MAGNTSKLPAFYNVCVYHLYILSYFRDPGEDSTAFEEASDVFYDLSTPAPPPLQPFNPAEAKGSGSDDSNKKKIPSTTPAQGDDQKKGAGTSAPPTSQAPDEDEGVVPIVLEEGLETKQYFHGYVWALLSILDVVESYIFPKLSSEAYTLFVYKAFFIYVYSFHFSDCYHAKILN